jgi:hypothetical protein
MEKLEPGHLGVTQIDHDAGARRRLDARLAQRLAKQARGLRPRPVPVVPVSTHGCTHPDTSDHLAKAKGRIVSCAE